MTPAISNRPHKFKFFKSKERIPAPPPPPRIREEDFLSEEEEVEDDDNKEVLREAVDDRRGQARAAEDLQDSLASELRAENRRGAQDDVVDDDFNLRDRRVSDRLLATKTLEKKRILSVRDYLCEKKSPKVFSSSPLENNENVSFPNDVSAIKDPNPPDNKTMAGRRKVSFDYIPGLDAPVRNPFSEAGEDSPASSPVHRSTRKAKKSSQSSEAKPNEGPETITVSDDSGDEGKGTKRGSKGQQEDKSNQGIQYKSECVTVYDYFSLEEGEYLNDAIINFHLAYLAQEKLSDDNKKDVHIFSTHFYTKLSNVPKKKKGESTSKTRGERAYERVKRWTKEVDLFSKKLVVIPICEDNHWYVLLICNPGCIDSPPDERLVRGDPYFIVMDSLGGFHTSALSTMRSYLRYEYLARKGRPLSLTNEKMGELEAAVPEQDNDCDCGVYLLHYIELIFRDPGKFYWSRKLPTFKKWFTTSDIKNKREDIANIIKTVASRSPKTSDLEFPEIRFSRRSRRHARIEAPIDVDKAAGKYVACGEEKEDDEEDDKDDGDKGDDNLEDGELPEADGELREAEAEVQKSKAAFEEVLREEKRAKERQEHSKKKKEEERKRKRLKDMMISSEDSQSPVKQPKVQLERLQMPVPPPPLDEVLHPLELQQPGKAQIQSEEAEALKDSVADESCVEPKPEEEEGPKKPEGSAAEATKDSDDEIDGGVPSSPSWSSSSEEEIEAKEAKRRRGKSKKAKKRRGGSSSASSDVEVVKEKGHKKAKKSKSKKLKKKKMKGKRRKSDSSEQEEEEVEAEEQEEGEVFLSDSDSSPRPFKRKGKKRSRERSDSSSSSRRRKRSVERVSDKKTRKKESKSLDPTDLRNSLNSSSSAFAKRTIADALGGSASSGKKAKRSVKVSYNEDDENEDSSSFFHVKGKRKVERVVEIDTESFDRTNPFSNARSRGGRGSTDEDTRRRGSTSRWKESTKGTGKFKSGPVRKFRR